MAKKPITTATQSARYRKFKNARNAALEVMLNHARAELHDSLRGAFQTVKEKLAYKFSTAPAPSMMVDSTPFMNAIDAEIKGEFHRAALTAGRIIIRLKMFAYTLAVTGEAEAIGQAIDYKTKYHITQDDIVEQAVTAFGGEHIGSRIELVFDRLRRRILDAVQLSRLQGASVSEMLAKVDRALPAGQFVIRSKRALKPVKEADLPSNITPKDSSVDMSFGFVDEDTWKQMVDYYLEQHVPTYQFRGPTPDSDYFYKDFELERDMTHEFVTAVRMGDNQAAKDNGITDFIWISVVDDRTDECCLWRSGLTTAEIEKELKGKHSDDECDTIVPPAHMNCRCDLAPVLEYLPDMPESNAKEFEDWLNS